jgi:hypothetical protein
MNDKLELTIAAAGSGIHDSACIRARNALISARAVGLPPASGLARQRHHGRLPATDNSHAELTPPVSG